MGKIASLDQQVIIDEFKRDKSLISSFLEELHIRHGERVNHIYQGLNFTLKNVDHLKFDNIIHLVSLMSKLDQVLENLDANFYNSLEDGLRIGDSEYQVDEDDSVWLMMLGLDVVADIEVIVPYPELTLVTASTLRDQIKPRMDQIVNRIGIIHTLLQIGCYTALSK